VKRRRRRSRAAKAAVAGKGAGRGDLVVAVESWGGRQLTRSERKLARREKAPSATEAEKASGIANNNTLTPHRKVQSAVGADCLSRPVVVGAGRSRVVATPEKERKRCGDVSPGVERSQETKPVGQSGDSRSAQQSQKGRAGARGLGERSAGYGMLAKHFLQSCLPNSAPS
jgi:hypothetical protein